MSELTAAIGANDTRIFLDEPLPAGKYFRIDDELVAITARSARTGLIVTGLIVNIKRGMLGTTKVTHDAGTAVEPYVDAYTTETPFNVGGPGSSEVQLKRVDAVVAFDDPDIATGVTLFTLPAGSLLMQLGVYVIEATNAGNVNLTFGDTAGFSAAGLSVFAGSIGGVTPGDVRPEVAPWQSNNGAPELSVETDIIVKHSATEDPWTQGSVRIVCIYAEPAA